MERLSSERWHRIDDLLSRALELPGAERLAFVTAACDDPEIRSAVLDMLRDEPIAAPALDQCAASFAEPLVAADLAADVDPAPGRLIGPYRIIAVIGSGGMGVVYLAERADGELEKRVALKLVKRGMDTDEILRRFRYERRILASLDHPHIATLHDGGASADGRPFLVMELIEGTPITTYCDEHRLTIDQRLQLFRSVCEAVQHAHQKMVIHRDVKPSNILVTPDGTPKLLDFGIAKLLLDDDAATPSTHAGIRLLTPEYAAPEQLSGGPVTTATDVYALGAVLYELLTGARAYLPAGAAERWDPRTSTSEVGRPSAQFGARRGTAGHTEESANAAAARGTTPDRLRRRLSGDLDTIVQKALDADPARRYPSPLQLIEDLDRHGQRLPVHARADSVGYRLRRLAWRYRAGVAAASASVLLIAGFTGFHTLRIAEERDLAQAEAQRAQTTTHFLQRLLGDAYPSVARGEAFSVSDLLQRAVARVDSLSDQPRVQADLLRTLGDVYREQGHFGEARLLLERSTALHRATGEPRSRALGDILMALGHLYYEARDYDDAVEAHGESLEIFRELFAPDDSLVLFALNNLATAAASLGNYDEALALHEEVLARRGRLFSDTSRIVHFTHNNLGSLYDLQNDLVAAEREFREAVRLRRIGLAHDDPSLALGLMNLGTILEKRKQLEEAELLHREALGIFERVYGPEHHRVALTSFKLAQVLEGTGRLEQAAALYRRAADIDRRTWGDRDLEVAIDLRRLGTVQRRLGQCDAAINTLDEADQIFAGNDVALHDSRRIAVRGELAMCLASRARHREAETILLAIHEAGRDAGIDWLAADGGTELLARTAELYRAWNRHAEADRYMALLRDDPT